MLLVLCLALVAFANGAGMARAEGSAQLYPVNATCAPNSSAGSCRANIEWRTDAYGPASGAQVRRRSYMQVYANAGEVLAMGSSSVGVGNGDILVYNPGVVADPNAEPLPAIVSGVNGFRCSDQRTASGIAAQGRITSRAQELAGPQAVDGSGNLSGYVPCSYVAPTTGIYGVVFYGPAGDGSAADGGPTADINLTAASNFDATQGTSVAAWDLTVRSSVSSTTNLTGRLFTNALIAFTGGNGRPVNTRLDVVTLDGFRYQVDTRGLDPNGFAFYGNQAGFLDGDGVTPLYHDAFGTTSSSELTGLAGGVTFAAPQFPIFFGAPANVTLAALGIPTTPVAPVISSVSFAGNITGSTSSLGAGGTFSYTSNVGGVYQIVISRDGVNFDPGAAQNRVLRGVRTAGTQTVTWDGKDNSGADFPVGAGYAVRASLHAGEYHFPLLDAENATLGGPSFTLLNPPGGVCPGGSCTTGYFDDRGYRTLGPASAVVGSEPPPDSPLCGTAPPAAPYHSDPVTGYDTTSALRAYGTDSGGNTNVPCTGSFGDVKGLDAWTYFPSTTASSSLDIVNSADVSITKSHTGSFTVGTTGTFLLTVASTGPDTSGGLSVTDALPAGLGYVSGTGAGWACGAAGSTVTCSNPAGLASGGSSAITLTVSVGPAAAPGTTNTASVAAVRADPNTANNSSSDPVSVIPIPIAVDDTATAQQDTPVTIGVTANDNLGATPTTITSHTAPANGLVTCTASSCTYTPGAAFVGVDTFHYTITDANGRTSTAKVTITITAKPPPAPEPVPTPAPVPPDADLATTVRGSASTAPGGVVDLAATVRNNGPGSAAGSEATLTVPAGFTLRPGTITIDGAPAGSACVVAGSSFTCRLGTVASGAAVQISWQTNANKQAAPGAYVVRANAGSTSTDSDPANNSSSWTIHIQKKPRPPGTPRLGVRITAPQKAVQPGDEVRITVTVSNSGTATAKDVVLCVPPPGHAAFVSAPGAVFRRGSACWSIGDLRTHGSRGASVVIRVDRTASSGTIRIVAVATRRGGRRLVSNHVGVAVRPGHVAVRPGGVTG
jgi:uncharacterized repeat protein (TIGR01451 family)